MIPISQVKTLTSPTVTGLTSEINHTPETRLETKKRLEREAKQFNEAVIEPKDGIYCNLCGNKLTIAHVVQGWNDNWYVTDTICPCKAKRDAARKRKESGMEEAVNNVGEFEAKEEWQQIILTKARLFVSQTEKRCFFIGGQSGSGKTHIATLICRTLMDRNVPLLYRKWSPTIDELTDYRNDERGRLWDELKSIRALYIDDLFKPAGSASYSTREIRATFDFIDARYTSRDKITIFSSELTLPEIYKLDTATARRIEEMAGENFVVNVERDTSKIFRRVERRYTE